MAISTKSTYQRKCFIAALSGLLCLLLSPYSIETEFETTTINLPWSTVFPILIALAYGMRYGLVAGLFGGALFPFLLWANNGYANLLNFVLLLMLFGFLGLSSDLKKKTQINTYILLGIALSAFFILMGPGYRFLFNPLLSLNPAFWQPDTINSLPVRVIKGFIVKDIINYSILAICAEVLLNLKYIRGILNLHVRKEMRYNDLIFLASLIGALAFSGMYYLFDYALNISNSLSVPEYLHITLWINTMGAVLVSRIIMHYVSNRLVLENLLRARNTLFAKQNNKLTRLNEEIESAKKRAEESDKLKSAFLANLSHEIRTPMNGIMGFAQLLKTEQLDDEKRDSFIDIIEKSGQQLLNIIEDIIDISKIETNQMPVNLRSVNISELIDEVYKQMKVIQKKDSSVKLMLQHTNAKNNAVLLIDATKIKQIITNLVSNALKFTDEGHIKVSYHIRNNQLTVIVADTGIGIPVELQALVFDRFRQVHNPLKRIVGGSGLGLAISKAYAKLMGGDIALQSTPHQGSVFTLQIPVQQGENISINKKQAPIAKKSGNKILIVEDNKINFEFLNELLKIGGYQTKHAANGEEAVEMVRKNTDFSAILMDIKLPKLNGYEALRSIRFINPKIPVIAQTAYANETDLKKIEASGFDACLVKPINSEELLRKLAQILAY